MVATAESLLQNSRAVSKIDCAEFQHSHEIAKFDRVALASVGSSRLHGLKGVRGSALLRLAWQLSMVGSSFPERTEC